jgi:F-type H+-transporting ATPase subunit a
VIFMNLIALVPRLTSPFRCIVSVGRLIVWVGYFSTILLKYEEFLARIVPTSPIVIRPLLFMIEIVSYLVRPIAMMLRIMINLTCRHLLLIIGRIVANWRNMAVVALVVILEIRVGVVQRYVILMIICI